MVIWYGQLYSHIAPYNVHFSKIPKIIFSYMHKFSDKRSSISVLIKIYKINSVKWKYFEKYHVFKKLKCISYKEH